MGLIKSKNKIVFCVNCWGCAHPRHVIFCVNCVGRQGWVHSRRWKRRRKQHYAIQQQQQQQQQILHHIHEVLTYRVYL